MDGQTEFIRYLRDQLERWAPVEIRRMFGGYGIFRDGSMFGLIHDETLYLRSDEASQPLFAAAGMGPFRYRRNGRIVALGYHEAPPEALEDPALLAEWAGHAYATALRRAAAARPSARKPRRRQPSRDHSPKAKAKRGRRG
jgi:DNA transformation protein